MNTTRSIAETTGSRETAADLAQGLRALAELIEANPELAEHFTYNLRNAGINAFLLRGDDVAPAAQLARMARAALRHGATVTKNIDDRWHNLAFTLPGGVKVELLAYRKDVCERVVVGVETVARLVPDPDALAQVPRVEVVEQVERVEWVCRPLLAAEQAELAGTRVTS